MFDAFAASVEDCLTFTVVDAEWFPEEGSRDFEASIAFLPEIPEFVPAPSVFVGTPTANLTCVLIGPRIISLQVVYPIPGLGQSPETLVRMQRPTTRAYEAASVGSTTPGHSSEEIVRKTAE